MDTSAFSIRCFVLAALLTLAPLVATAQPTEGQVAIGGDIGFFIPKDDQFDSAPIFGGFLDAYLTPRFGVRVSLFTTSPELEFSDDDAFRQLRLGVDGIYNWEGGKIHPFLGAGIAMHKVQFTHDGDDVGDDEKQLGLAFLGGLEYFLSRAWTVKGEGRYQWVDDIPGVDPSGFVVTVGVKRYF